MQVTLTGAPARLSLIPGVETDVYAYDGRIPGPALEVREGDVLFVNGQVMPTLPIRSGEVQRWRVVNAEDHGMMGVLEVN